MSEPYCILKKLISPSILIFHTLLAKSGNSGAFIDVFMGFSTNISSIYVICWYLFVWANPLNMFSLIKGNVDTEMKIPKVLGIKI